MSSEKSVFWGIVVACAMSSAFPESRLGWGEDGHQTVGAMADQLLVGSLAEQEVRRLLQPGESLSSVSMWADCAKYCPHKTPEMLTFVRNNPQHHDYHFTDIPFQHTRYDAHSVGAGPNDVVHIVQQATDVLRGHQDLDRNPHKFSRREALLLLSHLVGDLHQPLHVGTAYVDPHDELADPISQAEIRSGAIQVTHGDNYLIYNSKTLHGFWDAALVKYGMNMASASSPSEYATYLLGKYPALEPTSGDPSQWAHQWADNSLHLSKFAHEHLELGEREEAQDRNGNFHLQWQAHLPVDYTKQATVQARQAIVTAGKRLAYLLKAIWPD